MTDPAIKKDALNPKPFMFRCVDPEAQWVRDMKEELRKDIEEELRKAKSSAVAGADPQPHKELGSSDAQG
jgi:sugar-specific transcriptional regulator TrmB